MSKNSDRAHSAAEPERAADKAGEAAQPQADMPEGLTDREVIDEFCCAATDYGYRCASVSRELSIAQELLGMKRAGDALEAHIAALRTQLAKKDAEIERLKAKLAKAEAAIHGIGHWLSASLDENCCKQYCDAVDAVLQIDVATNPELTEPEEQNKGGTQ